MGTDMNSIINPFKESVTELTPTEFEIFNERCSGKSKTKIRRRLYPIIF